MIYSAESISVTYRENPEKNIVLSDTDKDIILDMFNLHEWDSHDIKARFQYSFSLNGKTVLYSDMGVFRDEIRNRDLCLSYEQTQLVKSMIEDLRFS